MLTPLPTAEVFELRNESKTRRVEQLSRQIAHKEQQIAELAHDIWLCKLEREGLLGG